MGSDYLLISAFYSSSLSQWIWGSSPQLPQENMFASLWELALFWESNMPDLKKEAVLNFWSRW